MEVEKIKFDHVEGSRRLREIRESRKVSLDTLANETGIGKASLMNYEKAGNPKVQKPNTGRLDAFAGMSANNLATLANYFGISADYLLCKTKVESPIDAIKANNAYTGLSQEAIEKLRYYSQEGAQEHIPYSEMISELLADDVFYEIVRNLIRAKHSQALADEARNRDPEYYEKSQQIHRAIQDAIALSDKSLVRRGETAGRQNTHEEDTDVILFWAATDFTNLIKSLVKGGT